MAKKLNFEFEGTYGGKTDALINKHTMPIKNNGIVGSTFNNR